MRTIYCLIIILGAVCALADPSLASVAAPLDNAPVSNDKPVEVPKPIKVGITPHRAIYNLSLASVKNGASITGVSGRMLFEWRDACDGWTVQQNLRLHFSYSEGDESDVASTQATWESKDGKRFSFNIRRTTDGKETESFRGRAEMKEGGGIVTYSLPEGKTVKLATETLFPSAHTQLILQKATSGDTLFSRQVFDGSDENGAEDVSVFIHQPLVKWLEAEMDPKLKANPLLDQTAWPIRMAFFKLASQTGEPDYEMNLNLLANGVARTMEIDYGDFSVSGTLSDIEPIPNSGC